ncbi:MarC family transcriptional regulator [Sphingomonas sp. Leaf231]|uniref:MarC family protein n=1 Tax=Sphingomonas sp. Leaf231 TaxID=1736301 RepID=UPI0006FD430B|nr:MarC family protein [Sphingomonas sp. Leaf231]KQN89714.1 MarC family transcriptional regulator [Sphingomonas sp. Leaf231]
MLELFVSAFVTLFVIIDPPGCAPIFAGLTAGTTAEHRRAMAVRAVVVAALILLVFALAGEPLLHVLGIELASFRIAGGVMLFLIALEMVFEKRTQRREDRAAKITTEEADDVSIFPMAMPMIAGPGSIASVMLLTARSHGVEQTAVVMAALAANLVLMLLALLAAGPLMRVMGAKIEAVITRLLGVLLAALAVQFVIDGIMEQVR